VRENISRRSQEFRGAKWDEKKGETRNQLRSGDFSARGVGKLLEKIEGGEGSAGVVGGKSTRKAKKEVNLVGGRILRL